MNIVVTDYNRSDELAKVDCATEWKELERVLTSLPLFLKASDQAGRQGSPIFDPVATNAFVRDALRGDFQWATNIPIPAEYAFLGTDIDAGKNGVMVEVQFSNYPFLLNNMLRSELFFQGKFRIGGRATVMAVIVTKGGMFPASNSTLYYEQAQKQLNALAKNKVFRVPLRLVGLESAKGNGVKAIWTEGGARYSRDLSNQRKIKCDISGGVAGRCRIRVRD
jgi:hypothetical protein